MRNQPIPIGPRFTGHLWARVGKIAGGRCFAYVGPSSMEELAPVLWSLPIPGYAPTTVEVCPRWIYPEVAKIEVILEATAAEFGSVKIEFLMTEANRGIPVGQVFLRDRSAPSASALWYTVGGGDDEIVEIRGVPQGEYELRYRVMIGGLTFPDDFPQEGGAPCAIEVSKGAPKRVTIDLRQTGRLLCRVVDRLGTPVPGEFLVYYVEEVDEENRPRTLHGGTTVVNGSCMMLGLSAGLHRVAVRTRRNSEEFVMSEVWVEAGMITETTLTIP